ncbi:MAG: hypothetical protein ACYC27_13430 [Armatimonadota bacterium]
MQRLQSEFNKIHLYVMIVIILMTASAAFSEEKAADMQMPDVLIWVLSKNPNYSSVSITFPKVQPKATSESYLAKVLQETGWAATGINITNDSSTDPKDNPMTSIEFTASEGIKPSMVVLPIEQFVKAFRDLKTIQILYMTPSDFNYKGVQNFENKYVKISFTQGVETFNYLITVKDPNFKTLGLPSPGGDTNAINTKNRGVGTGVIVLVSILALMTAIIVYVLTDKLMKKKSAS